MPHEFAGYVLLEKLGKISDEDIIVALLIRAYSLALFQWRYAIGYFLGLLLMQTSPPTCHQHQSHVYGSSSVAKQGYHAHRQSICSMDAHSAPLRP